MVAFVSIMCSSHSLTIRVSSDRERSNATSRSMIFRLPHVVSLSKRLEHVCVPSCSPLVSSTASVYVAVTEPPPAYRR